MMQGHSLKFECNIVWHVGQIVTTALSPHASPSLPMSMSHTCQYISQQVNIAYLTHTQTHNQKLTSTSAVNIKMQDKLNKFKWSLQRKKVWHLSPVGGGCQRDFVTKNGKNNFFCRDLGGMGNLASSGGRGGSEGQLLVNFLLLFKV